MTIPADFDDPRAREILRDLILQVGGIQNQSADISVPRAIKRLYHDRLCGINKAALNPNLPLSERIGPYIYEQHDTTYAAAMASRYGFNLGPEARQRYDVMKYPGDIRLELIGEQRDEFVRYLRNIGGTPTNTDIIVAMDGVNHLNIYSRSRVMLGRLVSNFWQDTSPYRTLHGEIATLEGYYHLLRLLDYAYTQHEFEFSIESDLYLLDKLIHRYPEIHRLFHMDGTEAIGYGRKMKAMVYGGTAYKPKAFSPHLERCFVWAMAGKFHQVKIGDDTPCGIYIAELVNANVPLLHYYVKHDGPYTPAYAEWLPNICQWLGENIDPFDNDFNVAALQQKVLSEYEPIG
ncbi:hypothetical protein pEaSNUABM11_00255 [Erwinia phage pEa_SNUABM_11]|nr:hypothetical protein pEaSNUABM11_00255 [Erwinia phage pEa_SNUABM_11]